MIAHALLHDHPASVDKLRVGGNLGGTKKDLILSLSKDAPRKSWIAA